MKEVTGLSRKYGVSSKQGDMENREKEKEGIY